MNTFLDLIIPIVKKVQEIVGVKVLYIFALPEQKLMDRYMKEYGFNRLDKCDEDNLHKTIKPRFDYGCVLAEHSTAVSANFLKVPVCR